MPPCSTGSPQPQRRSPNGSGPTRPAHTSAGRSLGAPADLGAGRYSPGLTRRSSDIVGTRSRPPVIGRGRPERHCDDDRTSDPPRNIPGAYGQTPGARTLSIWVARPGPGLSRIVLVALGSGHELLGVEEGVGAQLSYVEMGRRDPFGAAVLAFAGSPAAAGHQFVVRTAP